MTGAESGTGGTGHLPRRGALAVLLAATFMGILDVLIVNVAAPSIQRDLRAGFSDIQLVISGYVLAYAVGLTTGGRLGGAYGHKRVFVAGLLAFAVMSTACAAAPGVDVLIALRIGQGLAAALMLPQVLALIETVFPPEERPRALARYGATLGLGAIAGQLLGGLLIDLDVLGLGWRSVFLVNVPVGLAAAACAAVLLPPSRPGPRHRPDLAGLLLTAIAMTLLIYPLVRGGAGGWPPWIWPSFAGSVLALAALWRVEQRCARSGGAPLVRPALLRERGFGLGLAVVVAFYSGNYGLFLLLAYVFQDGMHLSPLGSGTAFLPLGVGFAAASMAGRRLVARYGRNVLVAGAAVMAAGYLVLIVTLLPGPVPTAPLAALAMAPALLLAGAGGGLVAAPLVGSILATVPAEEAGAGSAVLLTVNQAAISLGVAVFGTLFVALLGTDPQDAAASVSVTDFTDALIGCSWFLMVLAVVTGLLIRCLPPRAR
ncbi:putative transporter, MFS-type [Streptomyces sp. KO7888]|uniref:MFS transporter n=1 Tax=Streptomyces sp. KO7888 TaxID=2602737 RepID=UPI0013F638A4|nr:MFS transporter [Streptomyces sp. KO7888]NHI08383.1 putative transporter, MFS-type [Streptomyces sp. KO7888]